jgi:hypothetical protein
MRSAFAVFLRGFVLPFGATSGERIEFDGDDGEIVFYNSVGNVQMVLGRGGDPIIFPIPLDPDVTDDAAIGTALGLGLAGSTLRYRTTWDGYEIDFGYQAHIRLISESEDHTSLPPAIEFTTSNGGNGLIRGPRLAIPTTGADRPLGRATLVAGTVAVANQLVTASSRVLLTRHTPGGVVGDLSYATVAGTLTINSASGGDTSEVDFLILEPSA